MCSFLELKGTQANSASSPGSLCLAILGSGGSYFSYPEAAILLVTKGSRALGTRMAVAPQA